MELACGYRAKNEIRMKRLKREMIGLNPDALLIINLPNSQVLRVISRSLLLAMMILALPTIGSILRRPRSSLDDPEAMESHSTNFDSLTSLFRDLSDEGLLRKGNKGLVVSSVAESFMDCTEFFNENDIGLTTESGLDRKSSFQFDFVFTLSCKAANSVDRVIKIGGLMVMRLSDDPSDPFQQLPNYKIVYIRRFNSTVVAMRKTGLMMDESVNSQRKLLQCGGTGEAKKAALKGLEDLLLEPPPRRRALADYSETIKFLPDLLGDSLESYRKRIFVTDHRHGGVSWFYAHYPMANRHFEVYDLEIEVYDVEKTMEKASWVSDWLMMNVREEDFVVMKTEARVAEEMMREKTICLVDELFLECKNRQWQGGGGEENEGQKRAYWECLALYGRLRDEGIAVHQWWG